MISDTWLPMKVVRMLLELGHSVTVITGAPAGIFLRELSSACLALRKAALDFGAKQKDAFSVDMAGLGPVCCPLPCYDLALQCLCHYQPPMASTSAWNLPMLQQQARKASMDTELACPRVAGVVWYQNQLVASAQRLWRATGGSQAAATGRRCLRQSRPGWRP